MLYGLKIPVRYRFQWHKTTVGWLQRATWQKRYRVWLKSIALLQKQQNEIKKKLLLFESVKNVSFWEIWQKCPILFPKIFICVGVRQVAFLSEDWKKLSFWSSVLFTISALEMRERKTYRKQTGSNVSGFLNEVSALDWFVQASL